MAASLLKLYMLLAMTNFCCCGGATNEALEEEGHMIRKRFAEWNFEGYDTAHASHDIGEGRFRRSAKKDIREALKGDGIKRITLDLTSGKSMTFNLQETQFADMDTQIVYHTREGRFTKDTSHSGNCTIVTGEVEDGGMASFSLCDGLFGMAHHGGFEYFVHPVESRSPRNKRDVRGSNKVHVLWRRSTSEATNDVLIDDDENNVPRPRSRSSAAGPTAGMRSDKVVIELAMFSDAASCKKLSAMYPGREDEYLLTTVAASQALYSNRKKVGYDVTIKLKLIEYWLEDPAEYQFAQDLGKNLRSFREYTQDRYFYDIHGLNTGITGQVDNKVGLATMKGACGRGNCYNNLLHRPISFGTHAHEIGHLLGLNHPGTAPDCTEAQRAEGSFMGSETFKFSTCNKLELGNFLESDKASCLFEETRESHTSQEYQNLPSALQGQMLSPDELCRLYVGTDFVYYPPQPTTGDDACEEFYCLNNNPRSLQYGAMRKYSIPAGLPCKEDKFCQKKGTCNPLKSKAFVLSYEKLAPVEGISEWSSWSQGWTPCLSVGGTGVTLRKRECIKTGVNLKPYCLGLAFQAALCTQDGDTGASASSAADIIQARGDEVCKRLIKSGDAEASGFLPEASVLKNGKRTALSSYSCMLRCKRVSEDASVALDAILPDGTPCSETDRDEADLARLGIQLRCVQGRCIELSADCGIDQEKDACGICNGDGSRCVSNVKGSKFNVPIKERSSLEIIPAGSSNIEVRMAFKKNKGVELELWDSNGNCIIGSEGQYPNEVYDDVTPVEFAGTKWTFNRKTAFIIGRGPITEDVEIKAFRAKKSPIKSIEVMYAKPEE